MENEDDQISHNLVMVEITFLCGSLPNIIKDKERGKGKKKKVADHACIRVSTPSKTNTSYFSR